MRFSHPARRPLIVTAAALTAAAMLTGGSTAAFADTSYTPVVYTAGSVSDSRAAALSDPLSDITDKAAAALADAQTAIDDARATEDEVTGADVAVAGQTTLDTSALSEVVDRLGKYQLTPLMLLPRLVEEATTATSAVTTATDDLSARLGAAQAAKEAAEKAAAAAKAAAEHAAELKAEAEAKAAAEKAAAEKAAAEKAAFEKAAAEQATQSSASAAAPAAAAPAVNVNVDPASAQGIARSMAAAQYGWGDGEFACLVSLWNRESGWRVNAANGSGAYGIPQALPGSKMASAGADWATNPATQIAWGLGYISGRYGSPCGAWNHSQSVGWY